MTGQQVDMGPVSSGPQIGSAKQIAMGRLPMALGQQPLALEQQPLGTKPVKASRRRYDSRLKIKSQPQNKSQPRVKSQAQVKSQPQNKFQPQIKRVLAPQSPVAGPSGLVGLASLA